MLKSCPPETKEHTQTTPSAVKFYAPDPRNILLNGVRLDEYLQRSGAKATLKVRKMLEDQSWEVFESAYSAGDRPLMPLKRWWD
ncbi:MAG: hypothetical protein P8163_08335 [Candidatus Thiodiazotropha sp.]